MSVFYRCSERRFQGVLFLATFLIFFMGRSYQVSDSMFTILLGHSVIHHQTLNLKPLLDEPYFRLHGLSHVDEIQLQRKDVGTEQERWVTKYPQMPVFLSIPFIALTDLIYPVMTGDPPHFDLDHEIRQQMLIAALLGAVYAWLLYRIARLWLDRPWAVVAWFVLVFGSSVTSILSRAIWVDSWASVLMMIAIHHLAQAHHQRTTLKISYLTTLMTLIFFCKPLYSFSILGLLVWAGMINRRAVLRMMVLGMVGCGLYGAVSWSQNGAFIPPIYHEALAGFNLPTTTAFWGLLISPSRGVFVFWPWLIFILFLIPKSWRSVNLQDRAILYTTLGITLPLILLLSSFEYWFGGVGYGPRLLMPMLPWVSLSAIIILRGWLLNQSQRSARERERQQNMHAWGLLTITIAVYINLYGMMQPRTFYQWYNLPSEQSRATVDRLWDWRDPVWLAGIVGRERYTSANPY